MGIAKETVLESEGNSYFQRNIEKTGQIPVATGCKLFAETLKKCKIQSLLRVLEIGCCYGYNLKYLHDKFNMECYGIEPSNKAVEYGNDLYCDDKIKLKQGTADELDFSDEMFDVVMIGFCWFWMDRKYLVKALSEVDRVLKTDGWLAIWDFDTQIPYIRNNVHNANVPTYKYDLSKLFVNNPQYYLVEKRMFSADGDIVFEKDIQMRCALHVLYKENEERAYVHDEV